MRSGRVGLASLFLLAFLAAAAPTASAVSIEDLSLGDTWWGDTHKVEDLKGRVVIVEFWGFN